VKILISTIVVAALTSACVPVRSSPAVRCLQRQPPNSDAYDPMREARLVVTNANFRRNLQLPAVDTADVQFEEDPLVCGRISRALGRTPANFDAHSSAKSTYVDVIVIRLGTAGFYVQSMWHTTSAGEFLCHAFVFDSKLKRKESLCG
jgi:hypothetical protein